MKENLLSAA